MDPQPEYIQVLTPLKLEKALTYRVPAVLSGRTGVGVRVKVRVSGRLTDAVVTQTGVVPDIAPERIREIEGLAEGLERITPEEIRFWQFIADYYLCAAGEVFKCAYPSGKIRSEETAARTRERAEASREKMLEAARLRIEKLEAEVQAVRTRTEEALAKLGEKAIKTRKKLTANREARLERLETALSSARALYDNLQNSKKEEPKPSKKTEALKTEENDTVTQALASGKPVLLQGDAAGRQATYLRLVADTLSQGRTALMLVPEIALTEAFETGMKERFGARTLVFHSRETTVQRRKIADTLREGGPQLLIGTRSALFLPYRDLGLVIVDEEQDRSYKQDSPAPRYNARDCAVVLAGIHGAHAVLGSAAPSLESLYNCSARRYTGVRLPSLRKPSPAEHGRLKIIDTAAEQRKRGMKGSFSLKLIDQIRYTLDQGGPVYLIRLWGDLTPTLDETRALFPDAEVLPLTDAEERPESPESPSSPDGEPSPGRRIRVGTLTQTKRLSFAEGSLVALLQADPILGTQDFRADERAYQLLSRYREHCAAGTFLIQTARSAHPVFQDLLEGRDPAPELMEERKTFSYPPYSRIIDLRLDDSNPKRLALMGSLLSGELRRTLNPSPGLAGPVRIEGPYETGEAELTLRVILAKDRRFPERKKLLKETVDRFILERKYSGFIHLDVDPE